MIELTEKRTVRSKTYDLQNGGQRRLLVNIAEPMHYLSAITGKLEDIDCTPSLDASTTSFVVNKAPYTLRVSQSAPSYRYTSQAGEVSVTLVSIGGSAVSGAPTQSGTTYVWTGIAKKTDYVITPLPFGVKTELILANATSPQSWAWSIIGSTGLIRPIAGRDASGQICEINTVVNGDTYTATWSGRVTTLAKLRADPGTAWSTSVVYPVTIDPSINETISTGADDCFSIPSIAFNNTATYIEAGVGALGNENGGVRFQTIALPAGATISTATLTLNLTTVTSTPLTRFYGDDVDSAAAFATTSLPANITKTTAFTNFNPTTTGSKAIDVTSIIAEIAARPGWASGNNMRLVAFNNGATGSKAWKAEALEAAGTAQATLDITYTTGGGGWFRRATTFTGGFNKGMTGGFDG